LLFPELVWLCAVVFLFPLIWFVLLFRFPPLAALVEAKEETTSYFPDAGRLRWSSSPRLLCWATSENTSEDDVGAKTRDTGAIIS